MVGRTILHYSVVEKLGEGGMGVVYKAEDTQLRRTVALKFLSQETLGEDDVKERLIREAQAAASLDHPNICAVHGIHEEDGETFIAMTYVDGPSLAENIKDRPMPLADAISVATQVGDALQAAHERGVVHRDIKPQNILLTAKGQVKILDFGLAALSGRSKLTKAGTTLGTPAYMAPEQLEGKEADRRADIWALGCVFYEMLTQKTPFDAPYEQAIGYGILNEEPEPLTALRSGLPTEIDRLISKALAKDPAERYQHVDDLLADLRILQKQSGDRKRSSGRSRTLAPTDQAHGSAAVAPGSIIVRRTRHYQLIGAAAAAFLAFLVVLGLNLSEAPQRDRIITASLDPPSRRRTVSIAFSPDGNLLAASLANRRDASRSGLMVRALDSSEWREIPGTEGALYPFWSPDGTQIGFFADEQLKKVALAGGPSLVLAEAPEGRGGSWGPDGTIVFAPVLRGPIQQVSESGGEATQVTETDEGNSPGRRFPQLLPDGRHFLYLATSAVEPGDRGVFVGSLDGGEPKRLLADETNVWFTPFQPGDNHGVLLFARNNVLMARPFDATELEFTGIAVGLSAELAPPAVRGYYTFGASPSGLLAYVVQGSVTRPGQLSWMDLNGEIVESTKLFAQFYQSPRLSPDGRKVAYIAQEGNKLDVWVYDLLQETRTRLSNDSNIDLNPVWSADSQDVVFKSMDGSRSLAARSIDGSESALDFSKVESSRLLDWSSDGRFVLHVMQGATSTDIGYLERGADGKWGSRPYLNSADREAWARFSPNGRFVAYHSTETGRPEVYVQPFPEGGRRTTVSQGVGLYPTWGRDGKELFYASGASVFSVQVSTEGTFSVKDTSKAFDIPAAFGAGGDLSLDGQRMLVWARVQPGDGGLEPPTNSGRDGDIRLVQNWQQKYFPEQ